MKRITGEVRWTIDEFEFTLLPGTFYYRDGFPARSAKGTAGEVHYSENYEEAKGMMKGELPNTLANDKNIRTLRQRNSVSVKAVEVNGEFSRVMASGVLLNDGDSSTGTDGSIGVSIEGDQLN